MTAEEAAIGSVNHKWDLVLHYQNDKNIFILFLNSLKPIFPSALEITITPLFFGQLTQFKCLIKEEETSLKGMIIRVSTKDNTGNTAMTLLVGLCLVILVQHSPLTSSPLFKTIGKRSGHSDYTSWIMGHIIAAPSCRRTHWLNKLDLSIKLQCGTDHAPRLF